MAFQAKCKSCGKSFTKATNQGVVSAVNRHQTLAHNLPSMKGVEMGIREVDAPLDPPAKSGSSRRRKSTTSMQVRRGKEIWHAEIENNGEEEWTPPTREEWQEMLRKNELMKDLLQRTLMEIV